MPAEAPPGAGATPPPLTARERATLDRCARAVVAVRRLVNEAAGEWWGKRLAPLRALLADLPPDDELAALARKVAP